MPTLLDNDYWFAEFDSAHDLIVLRRQGQLPAEVETIPRIFDELIQAVKAYSKKPALVDLRHAIGRNDPRWEAATQPHVARLRSLFPLTAVIVRSAAGRLQLVRMARERGEIAPGVFLEEAEAIDFLSKYRPSAKNAPVSRD